MLFYNIFNPNNMIIIIMKIRGKKGRREIFYGEKKEQFSQREGRGGKYLILFGKKHTFLETEKCINEKRNNNVVK